jgi:prevent-host-death family protein
MKISVSEAKAQLLDLIRRAESGEEVVLTRHGVDVVRLVRVGATPSESAKRRLLQEIYERAKQRPISGESAARSQDFLYDEFGLPK